MSAATPSSPRGAERGDGRLRPGVRVLGIGSPSGDDRAGWLVVDRLAAAPALQRWLARGELELVALDRPGADLVRRLEAGVHVLVVDAVASGASPGRVVELDVAQIATPTSSVSGHHLGVAEALALASALGVVPASLRIYGVEAERTGPLDTPGEALRAALPVLADRLTRRILTLLG